MSVFRYSRMNSLTNRDNARERACSRLRLSLRNTFRTHAGEREIMRGTVRRMKAPISKNTFVRGSELLFPRALIHRIADGKGEKLFRYTWSIFFASNIGFKYTHLAGNIVYIHWKWYFDWNGIPDLEMLYCLVQSNELLILERYLETAPNTFRSNKYLLRK